MFFYFPKLLHPLDFYCFPFLFFISIDWYFGAGVFGLIECKSLTLNLHCLLLLIIIIIIIIIRIVMYTKQKFMDVLSAMHVLSEIYARVVHVLSAKQKMSDSSAEKLMDVNNIILQFKYDCYWLIYSLHIAFILDLQKLQAITLGFKF